MLESGDKMENSKGFVYCPYAEEFDEGDPCPHTGLVSCFDEKQICPMIESGYATIEFED